MSRRIKMAPRTPGVFLNADYHGRWCALAAWAVDSNHGAAARFALMYALALRRSCVADGRHVTTVRPRVWLVSMPCGAATQRVALIEDSVVLALLQVVDATADKRTPVFPRCPCGSGKSDDWAHSYASRKHYRGTKNFGAMCQTFGLAAAAQWSPLDLYAVSMSVFWATFACSGEDEKELLMRQLGIKSGCRAHYSLRWFMCSEQRLGTLRLDGADTYFTPSEGAAHSEDQAYD